MRAGINVVTRRRYRPGRLWNLYPIRVYRPVIPVMVHENNAPRIIVALRFPWKWLEMERPEERGGKKKRNEKRIIKILYTC